MLNKFRETFRNLLDDSDDLFDFDYEDELLAKRREAKPKVKKAAPAKKTTKAKKK